MTIDSLRMHKTLQGCIHNLTESCNILDYFQRHECFIALQHRYVESHCTLLVLLFHSSLPACLNHHRPRSYINCRYTFT